MDVGVGLSISILTGSLRRFLPRIFTSDQDILDMTSKILIVVAVDYMFTSSNFVLRAIAAGTGRLHTCALIAFVAYIIGHSIGTPLVFLTRLSIFGFWIAMAITLAIQFMGYGGFFCIMDWADEAKKAKMRVEGKDKREYDTIESHNEDNVSKSNITKKRNCTHLMWCMLYCIFCIGSLLISILILFL